MVPEEGVARLSLRPTKAPAFAAGLGSSALPCVALFLATRSAILARSTPSMSTRLKRKRVRGFP
jgi:hypothetical protein